jgi:hypothetical protein
MSSAVILAQLAIQLLPTVSTGVTALIAFIESVRTAAQQSNEWDAATEAAFRAAAFAKTNNPAYKP